MLYNTKINAIFVGYSNTYKYIVNMMKKTLLGLIVAIVATLAVPNAAAQERRPVDSRHPLWLVHIDVWNSADPQKIIDLIPEDIKPYVCMNLSLSCQYDTELNMYRMPRCAVRTYKSWASVCQANGLWFTCQPASGGHTHIQDDDLETFEYFFKTYPNFLGWNYAEQFWGFDVAGNISSSTQASRIALFAKLVPMHHKYGGFLTVSFCGNIWSHPLNPIGMLKRNKDLLNACEQYPEAILWLYKYTTSSCFYNNESVTFGPFISGLTTNYGVRYDNCGWNGALSSILGENNGSTYPGAAGIGTVMEQTCVNGGAVWDGPELIWTEDFRNLSDTNVDGFTRRNWGTYPNFDAIWTDMFRKIIDGHMYIPTRNEVVEKTKVVVINDLSSGNDEDKYAAWGTLYDGLYKQTDPFNRGNGQWMDNYCYFKKSGRYGTIPIVTGLYDDAAKAIPLKAKKSVYKSSWSSKVAKFDGLYPEVSTGDLYVNRYRNQLVTYTPYSYLNEKKSATAEIPLLYNTCEKMTLTWGKLCSGVVREYADHIDFYLNNYRNDTTAAVAMQTDEIVITGATAEPTYTLTRHKNGTATYTASATGTYDSDAQTYTLNVKHNGPVDVTVQCAGSATERATDILPDSQLGHPKQPGKYNGPIIIEAENMDRKGVKNVALTHSGWCSPEVSEFAGMGYVEMGNSTSATLRHQLTLSESGGYDIYVRYCNTSKANRIRMTVNGKSQIATCEETGMSQWKKVKVTVNMRQGKNTLDIVNAGGDAMLIDQIIYSPVGTAADKFAVTVREAEHGTVTADVSEAEEGQLVTLTVAPEDGYLLEGIRVVSSVYYSMSKTISITDQGNKITFTMPDDNVTLLPLFKDVTAVYKLDFSSTLNGSFPAGWCATQGGDEVHQYPNSYSMGARSFEGFTGYQGKALYWREVNAEYGSQAAFPLTLQAGAYKFSFACAAWKGSPKYKAQILDADDNVVLESPVYTARPNANGSTSANLTSAQTYTLPLTIEKDGNYKIRFIDTMPGMNEFLLLECRINIDLVATGAPRIADTEKDMSPVAIYDPSGKPVTSLRRGVNIVRTKSGTTYKVLAK